MSPYFVNSFAGLLAALVGVVAVLLFVVQYVLPAFQAVAAILAQVSA